MTHGCGSRCSRRRHSTDWPDPGRPIATRGLGASRDDRFPFIPVLESFAHTGFAVDRSLHHIYLSQEGVFGIMPSVLVTCVILFIFFGAFLKYSGSSRFFLDLPMALAGKAVGGPAKVAVMASGFFGSVSGSAIANTVSTGAFTIPLMKKNGFRPHVAGAIEPAASIGGMFMPPIMGAGVHHALVPGGFHLDHPHPAAG